MLLELEFEFELEVWVNGVDYSFSDGRGVVGGRTLR
jgi:hypothetical protein